MEVTLAPEPAAQDVAPACLDSPHVTAAAAVGVAADAAAIADVVWAQQVAQPYPACQSQGWAHDGAGRAGRRSHLGVAGDRSHATGDCSPGWHWPHAREKRGWDHGQAMEKPQNPAYCLMDRNLAPMYADDGQPHCYPGDELG